MLAALEGMITELRQIGVPISMTEKIDAVRSLNHLPLAQRDGVKSALRAALVKDHDHELAFDALFDLYFSPAPGADQEQAAQRGPADNQPATADGQPGTGHGQPGGGGGGGIGSLDDAALTELLLTALRDGNDVMLRAIAGMFVDRHAGIEPGRRVRSFVFVDGIDEVTDVLQQAPDVIDATRHINANGSGVWLDGRSDYGHALESFWDHWGEQVRSRTTVIVLGDARTNYHDPAERVLKAVQAKAAHLFWLNPEPRAAWNSGDSVIARYQPFCDAVRECRNIRQLRHFVEELD